MATAKELFLQLLSPEGRPERQLMQYEALEFALPDPASAYLTANRRRGATTPDRWGTMIHFGENDPGPTPYITPENKVCPDITRWRDFVRVPDLRAHCADGWEACAAAVRQRAGEERLVTAFMGTGIFEQCHFLMGFEDTLTNLYEHPREMHELIDTITDYRIGYADLLIDGLHPDLIFSHDDWGAKTALFMQPELWREFYKEPYRRLYGHIRSRGVHVAHHADSYLVPIVEDMVEIGIECWQGVLPENDIPALQRRLAGRMVLMGGIGAAIDRADASEEEIRLYVREVLHRCCPLGHFIPCITYGIAGTVYPHVDAIINEEIAAYNRAPHLPTRQSTPVERRRQVSAPAHSAKAQPTQETGLSPLAQALYLGQRRQTLRLLEDALSGGTAAQDILSTLIDGMRALGDDFSAGRVFVPELLMASRCLSAATERLRPLLAADAAATVGRACIGTVAGDLHDIGKTLVKIMLEGAGIEVIDLGVDVPAETFVQTAIEQQCDLIVCSTLLTTTMEQMRVVVEAVNAAGIRERVKILVGGAPVTQEFADAIGADGTSSDAAAAARMALHLLGVQ